MMLLPVWYHIPLWRGGSRGGMIPWGIVPGDIVPDGGMVPEGVWSQKGYGPRGGYGPRVGYGLRVGYYPRGRYDVNSSLVPCSFLGIWS